MGPFNSDFIEYNPEDKMCKKHKPFKGSYLEHQEYAEKKLSHGAKQQQCKKCKYWFFKNEY